MHEPAPTRARGRLTGATGILASVLFLPAAYCYACPPPDEPDADYSGVHIVPQVVWAQPGTEFILRARVLDEPGNVIPDGDLGDVEWTSDLFATKQGPTVPVKAPAAGPYPRTYVVRATVNGLESPAAYVHVTDGKFASTIDRVSANHLAGDPPALVLVDGRAGLAISDTVVAIAGVGAIDYLTCSPPAPNCGEVTLFARNQQLHREGNLTLTDACDAVELNGDAGFAPPCDTTLRRVSAPRSARVAIFVLASEGTTSLSARPVNPMVAAEADLLHAQKVLADGWTGISLVPSITQGSYGAPVTVGEGFECTSSAGTVMEQLENLDVPRDLMRGDTIVVAYVDKILEEGVEQTGINGITCPWSVGTGSLVLISWNRWAGTTLAHEIVHALGPWHEPPWGHTNDVAGVNAQNIMWEWEAPTNPAPRSLLTLGQAFRLSLDAYSLFYRGKTPFPPDTSFLCQGITSTDETPCPRLTKDVVRR